MPPGLTVLHDDLVATVPSGRHGIDIPRQVASVMWNAMRPIIAVITSLSRLTFGTGLEVLGQRGLCAISPGQIDQCVKVEVPGVEYAVAHLVKSGFSGRIVTCVSTIAVRFRAPTGRKVGNSIEFRYVEATQSPGVKVYTARKTANGPLLQGSTGMSHPALVARRSI